ncbi:uncharacterized protein LOC132033590 [Lycium ferocissimum]|uniref:uncharacterized protein LOC132033590 n=1 Tax=Lycium ferocissimum TaxID=112874 RepID=UPI00281666EE|nr:uncharacterized protein LOC132033590 [Lycium ferocissimum]
MSMTVNGQETTFDVLKATKLHPYYEELKMITEVEPELSNAELDHFLASRDPLEMALICIDCRKLNTATRKDHFSLPFMDQMLDRMPFGLCNFPGTFRRCMMTIFTDMVEKYVAVFMDYFSIFGDSFDNCLRHLAVLARCEKTNLVLIGKITISWFEKVLFSDIRHQAKALKLTGFLSAIYQELLKDREPDVQASTKDMKFVFNEACLKAFEQLELWLMTAPIIIAPIGLFRSC